MADVQLRNIVKSFGVLDVLKAVDFDIRAGEFVSLVGPSGCGKSTLLRMIAGLESVSGGEIRIGGDVVNGVAAKDRDIAMVFQNYALYPHMTVRENLSFALKMRNEKKAVIEEKITRASEILGLSELLGRYPRQLSGGQQQRVAMGRAIVRNPKVFLFDEPLSNLDAQLRVHMRTEIKDLHERLNTTTIYVTHDQIEAMTMSDRIVVMRGGIVEQIGSPLELYDAPANTFVATFIGSPSMNLLAGVIQASDSGRVLELAEGATVALPECTLEPGRKVTFGVRPEHLSLPPEGLGDGPGEGLAGRLKGRVVVVEPTGAESQIVVEIGTQRVMAAVRQRTAIGRGDPVLLIPDPAHLHFFDAGTGERLCG